MNEVGSVIVSLLCAALFSGAEAAFLSSNKLRFELDRKKKSPVSFLLNQFYRYRSLFLLSLSMAYILVMIAFVLQAHTLLECWIDHTIAPLPQLLLEIVLIAVVLFLFGRYLPQLLFKLNPYLFLSVVAFPLYLVCIALLPVSLSWVVVIWLVNKLTGSSGLSLFHERSLGKVDLDAFIKTTIELSSDNAPLETEVKILQNALDFSNIRLKDCMVPRPEIVALDIDSEEEELMSRFVETGFSKILIYRESVDNIIGYIHSSEMFRKPDNWKEGIKPVPIVPETMAANKLMKVLMQEKKTIAIVVDEFGGTSGIVTLEDLVEEIFGDFEDEHDTMTHVSKKLSDTEYVLSGRMEIDKVNEMFDLELPESDEYQTIAGMILHAHQTFPQFNETILIRHFSFTIIKKTATKIELVRLKILVN